LLKQPFLLIIITQFNDPVSIVSGNYKTNIISYKTRDNVF